MHRIAASPGGWIPGSEGVIFIEQTPASLVVLTAADTDIQTLAQGIQQLEQQQLTVPDLRVVNLLNLQQQLSIDSYVDDVLCHSRGIILRLLGGRGYWSYGLEQLKALCRRRDIQLAVIPGDDRPDLDLMSHSTVSLGTVDRLWRYFTEGGADNLGHALLYWSDCCLGTSHYPPEPKTVPRVGIYPSSAAPGPTVGRVLILFYRSHYLAGNTAPIDALIQALHHQQLDATALYVSSLKDIAVQQRLLALHADGSQEPADLILNTTSFAIAAPGAAAASLWQQLNVPVLQVILSSATQEQWEKTLQGLTPRDMAMHVALPEVDGRIITRAVSFKATVQTAQNLETDVVTYQPRRDRIDFVAELAARWVRLRRQPPAQRKIALILANYPNRDGRLANGVGLDTPASVVHILQALQKSGYRVVGELPASGTALIHQLIQGQTNDPEGTGWRPVHQSLSLDAYQAQFEQLPAAVQTAVAERWGSAAEELGSQGYGAGFPISGHQWGNIFVGIQPSRGYDSDPSLSYHAPDLEPTHRYLAFYSWLRHTFQADAIIHVGKHGNLEWLPGKSIALSDCCYPEAALGPMPHLYPFIVNDPGEGSQAKRRAQAVIVDHLTPPLTRAELYGPLLQLESLVDEYYDAQTLDPSRLKIIGEQITALIRKHQLAEELSAPAEELGRVLPELDGYLCELKEAQIRDGLHILGQAPQGQQRRDLAVAIARGHSPSLSRAIGRRWQLDLDPLTVELGEALSAADRQRLGQGARTAGDGVERIEAEAARLVEQLLAGQSPAVSQAEQPCLDWIRQQLLPALAETDAEIHQLLRGLNGQYVAPGPAGAPTRGRADVLPTGRNFYSVDIRAMPTESAWAVGRQAAEVLVEHYTQEHGEYPRTLGLSMWGTAAMRTGGDDLAEALALLGVRPVWDGPSRRVTDFEILPLSALGRPRVDVTLRISGFFRDAFANLIDLFDRAVEAVAALDEPPEQNPLAHQVRLDQDYWQGQGLGAEQAAARSQYRIFGSKPGAYGAGLQGLIESQQWGSDADLAQAYISWSSYAYRGQGIGQAAPEAFQQRLSAMQIVLHNQDNREHDLLDSDDYYQFQGGLTAAVKAASGRAPTVYFGDHSRSESPRVRALKAEIARVYRSRVVNPKWIAGTMRHGYKGAFEMAATLDYLFAYDATTGCVADHMYEGVAQAYALDPQVQAFAKEHNPWALRDMAERLLEAHQRNLWQQAPSELVERLRQLVHEAEAVVESHSETTW